MFSCLWKEDLDLRATVAGTNGPRRRQMMDNRGIPVDNSTLAVDNVATGVDSRPRLVGAVPLLP